MGSSINHYQIVSASLNGHRETDDRTFESLSILEERLEQLKKYDHIFSSIEFSSDVNELNRQHRAVSMS